MWVMIGVFALLFTPLLIGYNDNYNSSKLYFLFGSKNNTEGNKNEKSRGL